MVDLYHQDNFVHNFYGDFKNSICLTEQQRFDKEKAEHERHTILRNKWMKRFGTLEGFGEWESEHQKGDIRHLEGWFK